MGTFHASIEVADLSEQRFERMDALVDTGSTYLSVPRPKLDALGIRPLERREFILADDRVLEYDIGTVALRMDSRTFPVLCVFGEPNAEPLLGAFALEAFGLAVDPVGRRFLPVRGLMKFDADTN